MGWPYISRIEIENFRNLHGLNADFPASVVLIGENRSGKSNLLHALRLVLDPSLPDSARELRAEDFWDGLEEPFGGESISIKVYLRGFEGHSDAESILADCITSAAPMTACVTYLFRPRDGVGADDEEHPLTEDDYEHIIFGGNDAHNVGREVRRWLALTVLPAMRDAENQLMGGRRSLLRPLLDRVQPLLDKDMLSTVQSDLHQAAQKLLEEDPLDKLQQRINDRVQEVVGSHMAIATEFGFAASDPEQLLRSLRLYLQDGKTRSISDASLGTANVLFLCLLLQDLDERREKRASAGTILAIEEPEAHLHPHLQRLLFRYALNREHSVVVTTHSPHIASVAPLESLMLLRTNGKGIERQSQIHTVGNLKLSNMDVADLERYIDVTRAEMLFAQGLIFVEGMAEEFLVPAFAASAMQRRRLGLSLDELGITVCSVVGTNFAPYWRVTSEEGWDIPRVIITDGDPSKKNPEVLDGLVRGARLLRDRDLINEAKSGGTTQTVRKALNAAGIFVGETTLERDLISTMADEMIEAFDELVGGNNSASSRFRNAIEQSRDGTDSTTGDVIARIENEVGKGRFAQRLASKVTQSHEPPRHVKLALDRIFKLVTNA